MSPRLRERLQQTGADLSRGLTWKLRASTPSHSLLLFGCPVTVAGLTLYLSAHSPASVCIISPTPAALHCDALNFCFADPDKMQQSVSLYDVSQAVGTAFALPVRSKILMLYSCPGKTTDIGNHCHLSIVHLCILMNIVPPG